MSKDSEPADIIMHNEICLNAFQIYTIHTQSICIKNDAVLVVDVQKKFVQLISFGKSQIIMYLKGNILL